ALSRRHAAISGVQNNLVLQALLPRDWKCFLPFDRGSEGIDLPGIGKLVGNGFFGDSLSLAPQLQLNRILNIQCIVCTDHASVADNLQGSAIACAKGNQHRGQDASLKFERDDGRRLHVARSCVGAPDNAYLPRLVLQYIAQGIDTMDTDVGDGTASCQGPVVQPRA